MKNFIKYILLLSIFYTFSFSDNIVIGVRAHNGVEYAKVRWSPTIDYLNKHIPKHTFSLYPVLHIDEMDKLVSQNKLDFLITQPVSYINLKEGHGVTRMLTLEKKGGITQYGSVIITKSDNKAINNIKDIKGNSISGVAKKGFGGWLIGYDEMQTLGLDAYKECSLVSFLGGQEKVVNSVLEGKSDVGIVRTGILERMSSLGQISINDVNVINSKNVKYFPYKLSTELYPEWTFAKTLKAKSSVAKEVSLTLLSLEKDSEIAIKGEYSQWIIPLNYNNVYELMKRQKVGIFAKVKEIKTSRYLYQHRYIFISVSLLILLLLVNIFLIIKKR